MASAATRTIAIGVVRRAHGVRGEVRVEPYNEASEVLLDLDELVLRRPDGSERTIAITACRPTQGAFLMMLEGIHDKNAADALKGCQIVVARDRLPPPEPGEFYHFDLVGLAVYGPDGERVGDVARVEPTPGQDLLVVVGPKGERLVPLADVAVRKIDLEARRVDLEPWEEET